jgi:hypothetical protein
VHCFENGDVIEEVVRCAYDEEGNLIVVEDLSDVVMRDRVLRWQAVGQPMLSLVSQITETTA